MAAVAARAHVLFVAFVSDFGKILIGDFSLAYDLILTGVKAQAA